MTIFSNDIWWQWPFICLSWWCLGLPQTNMILKGDFYFQWWRITGPVVHLRVRQTQAIIWPTSLWCHHINHVVGFDGYGYQTILWQALSCPHVMHHMWYQHGTHEYIQKQTLTTENQCWLTSIENFHFSGEKLLLIDLPGFHLWRGNNRKKQRYDTIPCVLKSRTLTPRSEWL